MVYELGRMISTILHVTFYQRLTQTLRKKITDFNMFETYSFGRNVDHVTKFKLGRFTTRFYVCSYTIGVAVLIFYSSFKQRTITLDYHNPSVAVTQELHEKTIGTTECPCTRASIPFYEFVSIQTHFHQVSEK